MTVDIWSFAPRDIRLTHMYHCRVFIGDEDRGGDSKLDKENYALLCSELRK